MPGQTPEEIAAEARRKMDAADSEFEGRLKDLEERAHRATQKREQTTRQKEKEDRSSAEAAKGLGVGLTVAYAILGMPLAGLGVSWLIEKMGGPAGWQSGLIVLGSVMGVVFAIVFVNRVQGQ